MAVRTNGAKITVVSSSTQYHTLTSWGMAIGNNSPVGPPVVETAFLDVPGADGILDYSEAITGRPVYKYREINIELGGIRDRADWPTVLSTIRAAIHGKNVEIEFDDFPGWLYTGRAEVVDYDRFRELGTLTISIPRADPYAISTEESTRTVTAYNTAQTVAFQGAAVPYAVEVSASNVGTGGLEMQDAEGISYALQNGRNRMADFTVFSGSSVVVGGYGTVNFRWRARRL